MKEWIKKIYNFLFSREKEIEKNSHQHDWINVIVPGKICAEVENKNGGKIRKPFLLQRCWCGQEKAYIILSIYEKKEIDAETLRAILKANGFKVMEYDHEGLGN